MNFDKSKIKDSFARASKNYNKNAILQKMVAKNLVKLAKNNIIEADKIIDLGSGTGFIVEEIFENYGNKNLYQLDITYKMLEENQFQTPKIACDIEALPFAENSFDLGISSLSFQWLNDLKKTIPQLLKIIKNDGAFYFSTIGSGSLQELKNTCKSCQIDLSINYFISQSELKEALKDFDFQIKSEEIILEYADIYDLLRSIKSIGAGYSSGKSIFTKSQFEILNSFYLKNFNSNNKVFATWHIFYISLQPL